MLAIVLLALSWASSLSASCCSSSSAAGIARLLPHERALVELSQDARLTVGSFDDQGYFISGMPEHLVYWQFNHEIQLMTRLANFFLPFVKIPVRTQLSKLRAGSYIGDLSFGARWPITDSLHILSSAQAPTGSCYNAQSFNQIERVTGLGAWLISIGIVYEYSIKSWLISSSYHLSIEPRIFKQQDFAHGPLHTASLSAGYPIHDSGFLSASLSAMLSQAAHIDQQIVADSNKRKITASAAYNLKLASHVSLNTSLGADLPIASLAQNAHSEVFIKLGLRLGVF